MSRFTGALARAVLVMGLIAMPSLMLPGVHRDTTQIVALIAIFAALLTFFEYVAAYPCVIEFRDAPPFNRLRFLSLFVTVFLLTTIVRGQNEQTTLTLFVEVVGNRLGEVIDVPYSPVRLFVLMLPDDMSLYHMILIRTAAGISYAVSLVTLVVFVISLRVIGWPARLGTFNVWINLPTFDPTTGGDVVRRLQRDARFNIVLGFLLPFIIPAGIRLAESSFEPVSLESPQTLIWSMTAWAFLPTSLLMRGIAMGRIAGMIAEKRRRSQRVLQTELQPA
ncbi:hypothetical protein OEW28_02625 [Defluviimonas sp. WL0002]|uniref:Uncharacterized protein n=1 Tax=Albidovulum marisflavi TaxID=2984159 RepID=A0ABT2Z8Q5_9RHOB|nr:hypothetical protein [Defluviimonas sp. WL0002]MCV2867518.1 hypothetical protein [Defluviimonas sp. WL0002]